MTAPDPIRARSLSQQRRLAVQQGDPIRARLHELEALLADRTPGPWDVRWTCPRQAHHHDYDEAWIGNPDGVTVAVLRERYKNAPEDAALIVAAVNALPGLLAAVRAVAELADHLDERLDGGSAIPGQFRAALAAALTTRDGEETGR